MELSVSPKTREFAYPPVDSPKVSAQTVLTGGADMLSFTTTHIFKTDKPR
jgi:hypothetical protein